MALVKVNQRHGDLFDAFDHLFNRSFFDGPTRFSRTTVPAVNIKEDEKGFAIEVAAPGLKKEDFKIELDANVLHLSAETKQEAEDQGQDGKYSRREFSYSSFRRSFTLPESVDAERIGARYEDGVLLLDLPKRESETKVARTIEIG